MLLVLHVCMDVGVVKAAEVRVDACAHVLRLAHVELAVLAVVIPMDGTVAGDYHIAARIRQVALPCLRIHELLLRLLVFGELLGRHADAHTVKEGLSRKHPRLFLSAKVNGLLDLVACSGSRTTHGTSHRASGTPDSTGNLADAVINRGREFLGLRTSNLLGSIGKGNRRLSARGKLHLRGITEELRIAIANPDASTALYPATLSGP